MTIVSRLILYAILFSGPGWLKAAPGWQDSGFGTNGQVVLDLNAQGISLVPGPVVVLGDGKVVMACRATAPANSPAPGDVLVVRYLADGTLDPTFGTAGLAWVNANSVFQDLPVALLALPNGELLLGTAAHYNSALVTTEKRYFLLRLDSAGALDTTFSNDGKVPLDIMLNGVSCLALQPDGKVLVARFHPGQHHLHTRLRSRRAALSGRWHRRWHLRQWWAGEAGTASVWNAPCAGATRLGSVDGCLPEQLGDHYFTPWLFL